MSEKKEKKMKNWVMVRPRKPKEWGIGIAMLVSILITISPILNIWNKNILVLGIPLMFWMGVGSTVLVLIIINIAYRKGVY